MEHIRQTAIHCVGRAVMFGALAIGCVMLSFAFDPVSAFRSGAILTLVMSVVLVWKATMADRQNHRRTEVWLLLDESKRPVEAHAPLIIASVMREAYGWFARMTLYLAVALFAVSLVLWLLGVESSLGGRAG